MRWLLLLDERTPFSLKLGGAFAAIIGVGVLVVYGLLQGAMLSTFEEYSDQTSELHAQGMAPFFVYYYEQTGSWAGVERLLVAMSSAHGPLGEHLVLVDAAGVVLGPTGVGESERSPYPSLLNAGAPILVDGQRVGTLVADLGASTPQLLISRFSDSIRRSTAGAAVAAAGIALIVGFLVVRQLTRPLRQLGGAVHRIAAGQLDQRVDIRSRDVLGQLGADFNTMAAKLARSEALRRSMIADIAHELRTPLTVLQGGLQGLREGVFKPSPAYLASLHEESRLLSRLVNDLRDLSLAEAGELVLNRRPAAVRSLIERAVAPLRPLLRKHRLELALQVPANLPPLEVDPDRLVQVLTNLLSNALRHAPEGGKVEISAHREGPAVELTVSDTGPGIAPEDLPYVFERFWRADRARGRKTGGSGLGLSIVKQLVEAHGGRVRVESEPGRGTTFTLELPLTDEEGGAR